MPVTTDAILLRIFVGENDSYRGKPLVPTIIGRALERHIAGATVLGARDGFGVSRTMRIDFNSIDGGPQSPLVVEIVDTEIKINAFLPILSDMIETGLMTIEKVRARRYRPTNN